MFYTVVTLIFQGWREVVKKGGGEENGRDKGAR